MPTRASLIAAGIDPDQAPQGRTCYVCGDPVAGFVQNDAPDAKAARQGVVLGYRHRGCEPSEDAKTSRKSYLGVAG